MQARKCTPETQKARKGRGESVTDWDRGWKTRKKDRDRMYWTKGMRSNVYNPPWRFSNLLTPHISFPLESLPDDFSLSSPLPDPLHLGFLLLVIAFDFLQVILLGHNMPLYRLRRRRRATRLGGRLLCISISIGLLIVYVVFFVVVVFTGGCGAVFAA